MKKQSFFIFSSYSDRVVTFANSWFFWTSRNVSFLHCFPFPYIFIYFEVSNTLSYEEECELFVYTYLVLTYSLFVIGLLSSFYFQFNFENDCFIYISVQGAHYQKSKSSCTIFPAINNFHPVNLCIFHKIFNIFKSQSLPIFLMVNVNTYK